MSVHNVIHQTTISLIILRDSILALKLFCIIYFCCFLFFYLYPNENEELLLTVNRFQQHFWTLVERFLKPFTKRSLFTVFWLFLCSHLSGHIGSTAPDLWSLLSECCSYACGGVCGGWEIEAFLLEVSKTVLLVLDVLLALWFAPCWPEARGSSLTATVSLCCRWEREINSLSAEMWPRKYGPGLSFSHPMLYLQFKKHNALKTFSKSLFCFPPSRSKWGSATFDNECLAFSIWKDTWSKQCNHEPFKQVPHLKIRRTWLSNIYTYDLKFSQLRFLHPSVFLPAL